MKTRASRIVNIFHGEERYLLDREVQRALRWPERFVTFLDGESCSEDAIVSALGDQPVLDDVQGVVVVVDNAEKVKLSGSLSEHVDGVEADGAVVLVAVCRTARLSKGWAQLGAKGRVVEHPRFKPWEREKIKARVAKEAAQLGVSLADPAFDVLFRVHGEQTDCMVNEIRKATYLLQKGEQISADLVLSLCARRVAVAPWDVSEAAFGKDGRRALLAVSNLYQDSGDDCLVPIVASLIKQLEQTVVMRSLLDRKQGTDAIAAALGLHPYRVQKELPIVQKHTVGQLVDHMKNLCELEAQVKGAAPSKRTLVELAVLSLAA